MFAGFTVMMKAGLLGVEDFVHPHRTTGVHRANSLVQERISDSRDQCLKVRGHTLMRIHDLQLSVLFNLNLQLDVLDVFENILCRRWRDWESAPAPCALPSKKREQSTYLRHRLGTQHAFILISSMIVPIPRRTNTA